MTAGRQLALVSALLVSMSCTRPPELPPAVATFSGDAIRVPEFKAELDRARAELRPRGENATEGVPLDAEQLKVFRRTVLRNLVDRRLLLAEALKSGVSVTDREVDDALRARAAMALDYEAPKDPAQVQALRQRVKDDLVVDRFLVREVAARIAITPEESKAWYDAHVAEFQRPDQVRCAQIAVPKREDAEALKVQLNRGVDFAKLAREQSMSDDRAKGGDLGWFGHGQMPPEFENACFSLKKHQVSDVVQTPYGFHLFRLVDKREAQKLAFAEVEEQIDLRLRRERVSQAQADFVEKLRQAANVQLVEAEIDKVP